LDVPMRVELPAAKMMADVREPTLVIREPESSLEFDYSACASALWFDNREPVRRLTGKGLSASR
jgi:hypothetical protein